MENHFNEYDKKTSKTHNFWQYVEFSNKADDNYYELMPSLKKKKEATQQEIFKSFSDFDSNIEKRYKRSPNRTIKNINFFMKDMVEISLDYLK